MALRRIRSNLRTFRLALDPAWGTSLRAELAWYGGRLGQVRDLHILRDIVTIKGPEVLDPESVDLLDSVVGMRMAAALADIATERGGARRFQLNEQMMVLWDGPEFKAKAAKPADEILPAMLHRAWHDLRGAARTARKDGERRQPPQAADPAEGPPLRLRDGGAGRRGPGQEDGPGRRGAPEQARRPARRLLLHRLVRAPGPRAPRPGRAGRQRWSRCKRTPAPVARKGWNRELKVVERRWRRWQG